MFNIENQVNEAEITPSVYVLDISTDPPSIEEVKMAIAKLKNRKAADIGQISASEHPSSWQTFYRTYGNQMRHQLSGKHALVKVKLAKKGTSRK